MDALDIKNVVQAHVLSKQTLYAGLQNNFIGIDARKEYNLNHCELGRWLSEH